MLLSKREIQFGNVIKNAKKQLAPHTRADCFCSTSFTIRFTFITNAVRYVCICIRIRNSPRYLVVAIQWNLFISAFLCSITHLHFSVLM